MVFKAENNDCKEDVVYDKLYFLDLGEKLAKETIDNLRKSLKENSDE